ncbi:hypothetical protein BCR33DRAFT_258390 [Rhizoclosmatium globosum]|uniref:GDP-mannose transporter n=1 Tax=Rhizoclosmatium globosum TaxID=329046 RepID=A0A1Y2C8I8_9FUNG|nr:hypothetical protein BCR33DRAFT_258390 [Rhizoclosmatium globosum]|eukprot:ORY43339.1 hypothetical protein BCR33DRAFT_258390 [Rhizoclosmatium globosum]
MHRKSRSHGERVNNESTPVLLELPTSTDQRNRLQSEQCLSQQCMPVAGSLATLTVPDNIPLIQANKVTKHIKSSSSGAEVISTVRHSRSSLETEIGDIIGAKNHVPRNDPMVRFLVKMKERWNTKPSTVASFVPTSYIDMDELESCDMLNKETNLEVQSESESLFSGEILFAILGSILTSVAIVMVNKLILNNGFPFAATLTALHQLTVFVVTKGMITFGFLEPVPDPLAGYGRMRIFVAFLYSMSLVLMNLTLSMCSVAYYQLLKMSCIPTIVILQFLLFRQVVGARIILCLAVILLGIFVSTVVPVLGSPSEKNNESVTPTESTNSTFVAVVISLFAVLTTGLNQIAINQVQDLKRLSSWQLMNIMSKISFFVCLAAAVFIDVGVSLGDGTRLLLSIVELDWALFTAQSTAIWIKVMEFSNTLRDMSRIPLEWILCSCLLAVVVNVFGMSLIKGTSPVTFQVVGHLKTILTLAVGTICFGTNGAQGWSFVGIMIALVGSVLYGKEK